MKQFINSSCGCRHPQRPIMNVQCPISIRNGVFHSFSSKIRWILDIRNWVFVIQASCSQLALINHRIWLLLIIAFFSVQLSGQDFMEPSYGYEVKEVREKLKDNADFQPFLPFLKYDISAHRLTYQTEYEGKEITVSGLVVIPKSDNPLPVMMWCHGTHFDTKNAPSSWEKMIRIEFLPAFYGYITFLPDYIGYGHSAGTLPAYFVQKYAAATNINMLKASYELLKQLKVNYSPQIFLWGFSQGAYNTLKILRTLEEETIENLRVTAACAVGGPYQGEAILEYYFRQETHEHLAYVSYLFGVYNQLFWKKNEMEIFNKPYAKLIQAFGKGEIPLSTLGEKTPLKVRDLLTTTIIDNFLDDENHFIRKTLVREFDFAWTPNTPLLIVHGTKDKDVPFETAKAQYQSFLRRGTDPKKISFMPVEDAGHNESGITGIIAGLQFFDRFQ